MRHYCCGARIWAEFREGRRPELYEFIGADALGVLVFRNRRTGIRIAKTIFQITNYPGFKPFLINLDYLDNKRLIVSEETNAIA